LLDRARIDDEMARFRAATKGPINLNFFCHTPPPADPVREASWRARLAPYYRELGLDPAMPVAPSNRAAFDEDACALVEQWRPQVVSFHFGLPAPALLERAGNGRHHHRLGHHG
jgi:nitronate monooxygenase